MATKRIYKAMSGSGAMTAAEIDEFLRGGKMILRLATVDGRGYPVVYPLWYEYADGRIYLMTDGKSRKVADVRRESTVYFSVDTETLPYRGVKGRGRATIIEDTSLTVSIAERMVTRYLGDTEVPLGKGLIQEAKTGSQLLIEVIPSYYSVWDDGKQSATAVT